MHHEILFPISCHARPGHPLSFAQPASHESKNPLLVCLIVCCGAVTSCETIGGILRVLKERLNRRRFAVYGGNKPRNEIVVIVGLTNGV